MKQAPRATRTLASTPMPALSRSHVLVMLAYSAIPLTAAGGQHTSPDIPPHTSPGKDGSAIQVAQVTFNPDFFVTEPGGSIDLARYEKGSPVWPGSYRPDIYVNGNLIGRKDVTVRDGDDGALICFDRRLLEAVNVDVGRLPPAVLDELADPAACIPLSRAVPGATVSFDAGEARLDVGIAQAMLRRVARGYVDPSSWDAGVTSAMLGYSANVYRNVASGFGSNSAYVGVNAGVNAGGWYFRHDGALNWQQHDKRHYGVVNTYVQRDIERLDARLTLGDANTSGELFDTFAFRGVQIATDDRMRPDSLRGYAPVVHGIANSNARVTVRQGGVVLYDTSVPPGPFVIDDLYPTGYGGNLDVTITESDGSKRTSQVPYAAVAQSLRPGMTRFSLVAGTVRNMNLSYTPSVLQATLHRGVNNLLTLYGGVLANEHYQNVMAGSAFNTRYGALAFDVSGARTSSAGRSQQGMSVRVTYSKLFEPTGSNLSVAAYRFSSSGYLDFSNALTYVDNAKRNVTASSATALWRTRNRVAITATQPLGDKWGQVYASGFTQNYWERAGTDTQFQIGYSNRYRNIDYSVNVSRSRLSGGQFDTQTMFSASLPLGRSIKVPRSAITVGHNTEGGIRATATVSGLAGADNQASYSISTARDPDMGYSGNLSGEYRTPYAAFKAAFGKGEHYGSGSIGINGTVVAHPAGVTASPYTADTIAIVAAPSARGATVIGYGGVKLDPRGYAVVPYLTPYRVNEIAIDPRGLPDDVELRTTSQQVAPRAGATVMLRYPTVEGRPVLIHASLPDGSSLPFGAPVFDGNGSSVGMVTQGGQVYARLSGSNERLTVKWGHADAWQCAMQVAVPPLDTQASRMSIARTDARCDITTSPTAETDIRANQPTSNTQSEWK
ncbi:fimbria/pilus outer membrane usher protein [Burkholderia cepacia]|uniref:Fimbrial biogenesis outer membrane usher protein n=1 Tax=Burkholderia cepacia GG4 TaxID=1009846 RepID=A0A9W3P7M8_BURCE|nr:fimbria/pilus outer membrane usher protein [Burkholderia cepacia]AFQ46485.1 putative fimbrial biogenesis outer membrane usher protein [Burkholderia cepacia GG4]